MNSCEMFPLNVYQSSVWYFLLRGAAVMQQNWRKLGWNKPQKVLLYICPSQDKNSDPSAIPGRTLLLLLESLPYWQFFPQEDQFQSLLLEIFYNI